MDKVIKEKRIKVKYRGPLLFLPIRTTKTNILSTFKTPYCSPTSLLLDSGHWWPLARKWQEGASQSRWKPSSAVSTGGGKGKLHFLPQCPGAACLGPAVHGSLTRSHAVPILYPEKADTGPKGWPLSPPSPPAPKRQGNHKTPRRYRSAQSDSSVFSSLISINRWALNDGCRWNTCRKNYSKHIPTRMDQLWLRFPFWLPYF